MFLSFRKKTKISEINNGSTVVIEGTVRPAREMTLPNEGSKCVYFEMLTEVYKKGERGMGRPLWFIEKLDRKCSGFYVSDGTGEVFVEGPPESITLTGGFEAGGMLDKKGKRRFSARLIREGDTVRLRGKAAAPSAAVPKGVVVIEPDKKGRLEMIAKPKASVPK